MATQINEIFLGVPPADLRNALAEYLSIRKYDKYIVPCAGRFATVNTMINAGIKPENIITSDISLFTSLLGSHITGKNINELDIKISEEIPISEENYAASVFLAMKIAQIDPKNYYMQSIQDELKSNAPLYTTHISEQINNLKQTLQGITYEVKDLWEELEEWENKDVLICINPPAYTKGYTRMYDFHGKITWNEPKIKEFDPKTDYKKMCEWLKDSHATVISTRFHNLDAVPFNWLALFAKYYNPERTDYLITNKKIAPVGITRPRMNLEKPLDIPISSDKDIISEDSKISFLPVHPKVGEYYRDLFIHRLGATSCEQSYLALLNGKIFGVIGLNMREIYKGTSDYCFQVYAIARQLKTGHLQRLLLKSITCNEFADHIDWKVFGCKGMKTVYLAKFPEVRYNKNILKLIKKERLKNGLWKLKYITDWHNKTYKECLKDWLNEKQRTTRKKKRKIRPSTRPQ